jgi:hypothetical protein
MYPVPSTTIRVYDVGNGAKSLTYCLPPHEQRPVDIHPEIIQGLRRKRLSFAKRISDRRRPVSLLGRFGSDQNRSARLKSFSGQSSYNRHKVLYVLEIRMRVALAKAKTSDYKDRLQSMLYVIERFHFTDVLAYRRELRCPFSNVDLPFVDDPLVNNVF